MGTQISVLSFQVVTLPWYIKNSLYNQSLDHKTVYDVLEMEKMQLEGNVEYKISFPNQTKNKKNKEERLVL